MKLRFVKINVALNAAVVGMMLIYTAQVQAVSRVWISNSSTDFNLGNNWSPAGAPTGADDLSIGSSNTSDATLTANATINSLIFTNGRSVQVDTGTFTLTPDGGVGTGATDISVTGAGHVITGDKNAADLLFSESGNYIVTTFANSSLRIEGTIGNFGLNTRLLKDGSGSLEFAADNSASWTPKGTTAATFQPITVRGGVLTLSAVGARGSSTSSLSTYQGTASQSGGTGGGTIRLAADFGEINDGTTFATQGFLELSGRGWTGGSFATGEGALYNTVGHNSLTTSNGGDLRFGNNGSVLETGVRIRVADSTSLTVSVPIVDGAGANLTNGIPTFEKTGPGLLVFNGSNKSYSGNTSVMEGTLQFDATYNGAGDFIVNSGATLGGIGNLGASSVALSGTLAPGASAGTFTSGGLEILDGSAFAFELNPNDTTIGSGVNDLVVTGLLDLSGVSDATTLTLDVSDAVTSGDFAGIGTWTLFQFAGSSGLIDPNDIAISGLAPGYTGVIGFDAGAITLSVVPEPGSIALIGMALGGLGFIRRRRFIK